MLGHKAERESAVCPASQEDQQPPRLYEKEHSQQINRCISLYLAILRSHLEHCIQFCCRPAPAVEGRDWKRGGILAQDHSG